MSEQGIDGVEIALLECRHEGLEHSVRVPHPVDRLESVFVSRARVSSAGDQPADDLGSAFAGREV